MAEKSMAERKKRLREARRREKKEGVLYGTYGRDEALETALEYTEERQKKARQERVMKRREKYKKKK